MKNSNTKSRPLTPAEKYRLVYSAIAGDKRALAALGKRNETQTISTVGKRGEV